MSAKFPPPPGAQAMLNRVATWLHQRITGPADPSILLEGFPFGPLLSATLEPDGAISVQFRDQREPDRPRSTHTFDAEGLVVVLLIAIVRPQLLISRTDLPPRRERHYVTFGDTLPLWRILTDAKPGQTVTTASEDHLNSRRSNLVRQEQPQRNSRKGRADAVSTLTDTLALVPADQLSITTAVYAALLALAFKFLDELPLGSAESSSNSQISTKEARQ